MADYNDQIANDLEDIVDALSDFPPGTQLTYRQLADACRLPVSHVEAAVDAGYERKKLRKVWPNWVALP